MLDIKKIRADFDGVAAKLATRGVEKEKLEKLHDLDIKRRELIVKSEALKAERNSVSDEISQVKRAKGDASTHKLQRCKKFLLKSKPLTLNLLKSKKT